MSLIYNLSNGSNECLMVLVSSGVYKEVKRIYEKRSNKGKRKFVLMVISNVARIRNGNVIAGVDVGEVIKEMLRCKDKEVVLMGLKALGNVLGYEKEMCKGGNYDRNAKMWKGCIKRRVNKLRKDVSVIVSRKEEELYKKYFEKV